MVRGTRFVAPAWNVSLEAPGADWTWSYTPEPIGTKPIRAQSVACQSHDAASRFVMSAFEGHHGRLDLEEAKDIARGTAKRYQQEGWTAEVLSTTEDSIPLPASYRYVIEARRSDGTVHVFGYIASKGRLLLFQHPSDRQSEPHEFRRFVESYQFVGKAIPDPVDQLANSIIALTCGLTVLLGGCGFLVNRLAGRTAVNLWYVALAALLAVGVASGVFVAPRVSRLRSPTDQGRHWGQLVIGPVFWPGLLAVWRARALRRKRAAERHGGPPRVDGVFD